MISHRLQKGAIVTDADDRFVGTREVAFEPRRGIEVEVVGGFVEDVQVGGRGELPCQRHAPALATAQRANARLAGHVWLEAHAHENGIHLRRHLVAAIALEALEVAAVLLHGAFAVIVLEVGGLLRERMLQLAQVAEGVGHDVPQTLIGREAPVLVHERHSQPWRARHRPARGLQIARDEPHECGLAGPIASHDGPAIAGRHREGDVAKDFRGAEIDARVAEGEKRHARE